MRKSLIPLAALVFVPTGLAAQTSKLTLLFPQLHDADSLDTTAASLGKIHRLDIAAVTPGSGATMFPAIPIAGFTAMIGDGDKDGVAAEYYKDASQQSWTFSGCLVKHADKQKRDRRLVYWTVKQLGTPANKLVVFQGAQAYTVRQGDFIRLDENGRLDFFITQDLIMKAAGQQQGGVAKGALDITQDKDGDLYYSPPHNGHYVSDGTKQTLALEGAIVWIPRAGITYDAQGNVKDVKAGSARLVAERGSNNPSPNPNSVAMVTNSVATDAQGNLVATTLTNWITAMVGLAIDPNGGTWTSRLTGTAQHPNFIFAFDNDVYRATVFSTAKRKSQLGSIAKINGVQMGQTFGRATGAWIGAKGQNKSPTLHGLEVVDWGLAPQSPWGLVVLDTRNAGGFDQANDATFALDFQGLEPFRPIGMTLGFEAARGQPLLGVNVSAAFDGCATVYSFNLGPIVGSLPGISDARGRKLLQLPVIKDKNLLGLGLVWQGFVFLRTPGKKPVLSNPIVTEFR